MSLRSPSQSLTCLFTHINNPLSCNCCLLNARSVVNKLPELHYLLYFSNYDIILITEFWLHAGITNGLLDPDNKFTVMRCDRPSTNCGGGVCAFVRNSLQVTPVNFDNKYADLELLCFDRVANNSYTSVRFFLTYRAPSSCDYARDYIHLLIECLKRYHYTCYTSIIIGDLNLPKIDWFKLSCIGDLLHKPILDFVIDYGFTQIVQFPTRGPNIFDVVLVDNVHAVLNI